MFLGAVSLISRMIFLYCLYYMDIEKNDRRFRIILFLFILSMVFLIVSPNLARILLGWDGLGLRSYALVIYYNNERSANAGMLTVLRNRVGDVAILIRIGFLIIKGGLNFLLIDRTDFLVRALVVLAAFTKSAQIPFRAWLPAAIAAPTPVSSLVHSSTLVTAGVYLIIRFFHLISENNQLDLVLWIGVLTIFMSGLGANFEEDLKKVVALSTLRQLGLIIIVLGFGIENLAFFHLIIHALFKSRLFICRGFIIHRRESAQDSRLIGGFSSRSPLISLGVCLTNLALIGRPFLAGFYSKDLILENIFSRVSNTLLRVLIVASTAFTVSYRVRFMFKAFRLLNNIKRVYSSNDLDKTLSLRLAGLLTLRVLGGFSLFWVIFIERRGVVLVRPEKYYVLSAIFISALLIGSYLSLFSGKLTKNIKGMFYKFVGGIWFLPSLSSLKIRLGVLSQGGLSYKLFDLGWLEGRGPKGVGASLYKGSLMIQKAQIRVIIRVYAGVAVLMVFFWFIF